MKEKMKGDMIVDHEGLFEVNVEKSWEARELEDKLFPSWGGWVHHFPS